MFPRKSCKAFVLSVVVIILAFRIFPAAAENFHLSEVTAKNASGIQDLDITISLDWDPDTVKKTDAAPRGFTKDEFKGVIDSFAKSLYSMTNGKHRLRNVYVYKSRHHWDKADVRYISKEAGTSKANVSAWKKSTGQIVMYVYEELKNGKYILDDSPGPVLAHECGHYIYGLYDEYKEMRKDGKTRAELEKDRDFGTPAKDDDGTQKSIMNAHASYPYWFSVDSGYNTEAKKNSAHYRMFKKSIWSTLVSNPASDHANAIDDNRTWFEAFKGLSVKAETDLLAGEEEALEGWDKAPVNIIWMGKTSHFVLALDNDVSATDWIQSKNNAAAAVRAMTVDNRVSVVSGESVAITDTKLSDANKSTVITQISSIATGTSVPVEQTLRKAFNEIKNLRKSQTEQTTYFIYLFTSGNPAVPAAMKKELTDAKAMLTVSASDQAQAEQAEEEGKLTVRQLSEGSGARSNTAARGQKMESQVARNINFMEADSEADIAAGFFEGTLASGTSRVMSFIVGPRDTLITVGMFCDQEEWNDIMPSLIDPKGNIIAEGGLPAGVVLEKDQNTGIWLFGIDTSTYTAGALGKWSARMTAQKTTLEPFAMIASTESDLALKVEVTESPLFGYVTKASLKADRPILNARVTAGIYGPEGTLLEFLTLRDDGADGDVKANDGIYSARVRTAARNLEYTIIAWADDNNGQAQESDRGMVFVSNENIIERPAGTFQRTDESAFTMKLNGGSSGRCFIAHAAYGSYLDPHVDLLRNFRDRWLLPYHPGQMLVGLYYKHSPDIAAFIRQHEAVRFVAMAALTPIVYSIKYPFLLIAAALAGYGYRKRKNWIPKAVWFFKRGRK